ncbi:MAG: DNA polymerase III subunit beta [Proteobacteria bacterium]|jgi:DNA polymerase-3 subunit beta|nr:DNA polymerase III subunit beta [Pseudomonadota bacterium]MBK7115440.1 DNA polymerase III subunit beta [Pseudomonadota bacterium]MBK9253544.1 DNA polymerase III subunit beta [Pseudomonadota bacterium]MCC6630579.1 DNA polymerase III subunit beta [Gammaproteobacteria bacterium]
MKFTATREQIIQPVQAVIGVVERKQTMPVLANVLLSVKGNRLSVTGTDLEVELVASGEVNVGQPGEITVPGRKLLEIAKALPDKVSVTVSLDGERLKVVAGRSRFTLSTLAATEFPVVESVSAQQTLTLPQAELGRLIAKTHFSMAQQDVRYYLNGTLLETDGKLLRTVATDGHRLAIAEAQLATGGKNVTAQQVIVPRKGILELQRILGNEGDVEITIGSNHIRLQIGDIRFTSKLIDGKFPDYGRVIPASPSKAVVVERDSFRAALQRTAILSNEKYRGVRVSLAKNSLKLQAHNPEQEEAQDEVEIDYAGEEMEIGFNVTYLLDALTAIDTETVELGLTDSNSSCLIRSPGTTHSRYVVMPMRL